MEAEDQEVHYRSVFISDVHLGTRGCQAELLLHLGAFLAGALLTQVHLRHLLVDNFSQMHGRLFFAANITSHI